jgi:radical SAM superfamily enzyme YgiQ (UPF0313 family)
MTGEQIKRALEISTVFRGRLPIVWGGLHPTILPKQTLESELVDYIVIGEGEEAFLNLLHYLSGREVDHPLFLSKNHSNYGYNYLADLDACGYVDFSSFPISDLYFTKRDGFQKAFAIETSRGCPFCCSFCHNSIFKKPYRTMSAENVLAVVDSLRYSYKVDGIIFQEDNFFANRSRVDRIVQGLVDRNDVGWKANSRVSYFHTLAADSGFMDKLLRSRCTVLQFGIESGSRATLTRINKKIDPEEVIQVNRRLSAYPIRVRYNFMVGIPGEDENDVMATMHLIDVLRCDNPHAEPPFLNIYNPYPGTPLYADAITYGFKEPKSLSEWSDLTWSKSWLSCFPAELRRFMEAKSAQFATDSLYLRSN